MAALRERPPSAEEAGSQSMAVAARGRTTTVVHVLSQFPGLGCVLEKILPSDVAVKVVSLSEKRFNWNLKLKPEEKEQVRNCEVLVADNTLLGQVIYDVPNLKWAQATWTGVDHLMSLLDPQKPKPSFLMSRLSTDDYSAQMAEYVMAQIINRERMFYQFWDMQKTKTWDTSIYDFQDYRIIGELTIGILGGGVFASAIAKLLKACSAKIISFVRTPRIGSEKPLEFDQMETDLSVVLKESDYICNTLPSTPNTRGLLDGDVLKQCLKKPVFINLGRGDIINDTHLIHALKEKWIAGAVLDVFETEPLPADSKLWNTPEVIVTPHIGANTHVKHVTKCFLHNFNLYRAGQKPQYLIDWHRGY